MKITKTVVNNFEDDQRDHGTVTALSNFVWEIAAELFKDIGVKNIQVSYNEQKTK